MTQTETEKPEKRDHVTAALMCQPCVNVCMFVNVYMCGGMYEPFCPVFLLLITFVPVDVQ